MYQCELFCRTGKMGAGTATACNEGLAAGPSLRPAAQSDFTLRLPSTMPNSSDVGAPPLRPLPNGQWEAAVPGDVVHYFAYGSNLHDRVCNGP